MQVETKFLRLKIPVTVGSYFGDWRVTWVGGWTRDRLSYLVMVARCASRSGTDGEAGSGVGSRSLDNAAIDERSNRLPAHSR